VSRISKLVRVLEYTTFLFLLFSGRNLYYTDVHKGKCFINVSLYKYNKCTDTMPVSLKSVLFIQSVSFAFLILKSKIMRHRVLTGSGAHPAYYPMGTRSSFRGGEAAGA